MPPWKLRGARACKTFSFSARAALKSNGFRQVSSTGRGRPCLRTACCSAQTALYATRATEPLPLRKQLKDEAKAKRATGSNGTSKPPVGSQEKLKDWELTVGIECHAQLNTARKLFSRECLVHDALAKLTFGRCGHFYQR